MDKGDPPSFGIITIIKIIAVIKVIKGYTLVELLVAIAVMGFIAAIAFFGLRSYNNSQQVINAQKDFANLLRATQNKVVNGADGLSIRVVHVPADITTLPAGVSITSPNVDICFNNPNLLSSSCTNTFPIAVTFSNSDGSITKTVTIEGSGLFINRIYAN